MAVLKDSELPPPSYNDAVSSTGSPATNVPPGAVSSGPWTAVPNPPASSSASASSPASPPPPPAAAGTPSRTPASRPQYQPPSAPPPTAASTPKKPLLSSQPQRASYTQPSPHAPPGPGAGPDAGGLYHYQNPRTGHTISSPLPPSHPAMQCLQSGSHVPGPTHFGLLGILSAIILFPVGIACLLVDRSVRCKRCGEMLHDGC